MFIDSEEQLKELQNTCIKSQNQKTQIVFTCRICGKESHRRLLKKETRLICSNCLAKITTKERCGVENPSQLKEIKEKKKQTSLKHFGVENPMQCKKVVQTLRENNLQKYGVIRPTQTEEVKNKMRQTIYQKYGVNWYVQSKEFKKKCKEAWDNKSKEELEITKQKRKQTL